LESRYHGSGDRYDGNRPSLGARPGRRTPRVFIESDERDRVPAQTGPFYPRMTPEVGPSVPHIVTNRQPLCYQSVPSRGIDEQASYLNSIPQMSDSLLYTWDLPGGNNKGMDHLYVVSLVKRPNHEVVPYATDSSALTTTDVDQQAIPMKPLVQVYTVSYFRPPEDVPPEPPPSEDIPPEPPPSVV
jgi:hypothetical protein